MFPIDSLRFASGWPESFSWMCKAHCENRWTEIMASIHCIYPWAQMTRLICHIKKVVCPFRNLASSYVYHCIISSVLICCACAFLMVMLIFVSAGTPGRVTVMAVRWHAGWTVVRGANKALITCRRFNDL